jgi:hypothetical protein
MKTEAERKPANTGRVFDEGVLGPIAILCRAL